MTALTISADHPDAGNRLMETCAQALRMLGVRVCVRHGADNALRMCAAADEIVPFAPRAPAHAFAPHAFAPHAFAPSGFEETRACTIAPARTLAIVEVEGLANLLHELVHVALAGRVADDHGYDYGAIPYALETAEGRAILWEEIACCVVSCAYLAQSPARIDAWFAEQLGIQPLFYGLEDRPAEFFARLDALARDHGDELAATLHCAWTRVERWIGPPPARFEFTELWRRWQAGSGVAA
jgi:hypothetical protein